MAAGIFIDLKKAFDTILVPLKDIIGKLYKHGMRGQALNIYKSYLTNRLQYVKLNDAESNKVQVEYGIPQGSILGPLIFLLYVNDIFDVPFKGDIQLFADDTVITYSNASPITLRAER